MPAMARFFPLFMDAVMIDADKSNSPPSEYVDTGSGASATTDGVVIATVKGVQNKNYAPDATTEADPTITHILPTDPWPSVSELTTYSAPSETPVEISTSVENEETSYSPTPSPSPSPSTSSSTSSLSSLSTSSSLLSTTTAPIPTPTSNESPAATSSSSDPTSFSGGTSKTTKIAIAVPVSVIGLALICAVVFFLARRKRHIKERNALPPPYDIATRQTRALSAQELMVATKSSTPEPRGSLSAPATALSRIPIINISPSTDDRGRTPSPGLSPRSGSVQNTSRGPGDSEAELGVAIAVPMERRQSATEQEVRGRVGSVASSRVPSRLARMPFEDFEDDEVGVGIAVSGDDGDDGAVSDVSDSEDRRGRGREYDEVSIVSSFDGVSPISPQERRQFR